MPELKEEFWLFAGTYSKNEKSGIELFKLNIHSQQLVAVKTFPDIAQPSYLAWHAPSATLYAVNEVTAKEDAQSGHISVFKFNSLTHTLKPIQKISTMDYAPCYLSLSKDKNLLFSNNYLGGSAQAFSIAKNGTLTRLNKAIHQSGSGPIPNRQNASHIHSVEPHPSQKIVAVADLGGDSITLYPYDNTGFGATLFTIKSKPGAGPRHCRWSGNGRFLYVVNELNNSVELHHFKNNKLHFIQSYRTIPEDWGKENWPSDLHILPNGKFLFVSNRIHNSIVCFKIDAQTGELSYDNSYSCYGDYPRTFTMDPSGRFLLVANQKSCNIALINIHAQTCRLTFIKSINTAAFPAHLKLIPL